MSGLVKVERLLISFRTSWSDGDTSTINVGNASIGTIDNQLISTCLYGNQGRTAFGSGAEAGFASFKVLAHH